jgi:drug/metabolite transporter (DMT)-like permease
MRLNPRVVVAIGVVFTSFSAILVRLSDAPPLAVASWRMIFTTALLTPLVVYGRVRSSSRRSAQDRAQSDRGRTGSILLSVASGALLALHFALWITSLSYTSVANSTILVTTHPVIVGIAGLILLGERIPLRGVLFMITALAGSILLVWGGLADGESATFGNLLAFLGAVTVSGYLILGRVARRHLSLNGYTIIVYSVAAALLVAASLLLEVPLGPYPAREFVIFLSLAVFCTLLGHSLFSWALKYLPTTIVSTSILGEPVIAVLLAILFFGEIPTLLTFIAGSMILVSVYRFLAHVTDQAD